MPVGSGYPPYTPLHFLEESRKKKGEGGKKKGRKKKASVSVSSAPQFEILASPLPVGPVNRVASSLDWPPLAPVFADDGTLTCTYEYSEQQLGFCNSFGWVRWFCASFLRMAGYTGDGRWGVGTAGQGVCTGFVQTALKCITFIFWSSDDQFTRFAV